MHLYCLIKLVKLFCCIIFYILIVYHVLMNEDDYAQFLYASLFRQKQAFKNKQTRKKQAKNKYFTESS